MNLKKAFLCLCLCAHYAHCANDEENLIGGVMVDSYQDSIDSMDLEDPQSIFSGLCFDQLKKIFPPEQYSESILKMAIANLWHDYKKNILNHFRESSENYKKNILNHFRESSEKNFIYILGIVDSILEKKLDKIQRYLVKAFKTFEKAKEKAEDIKKIFDMKKETPLSYQTKNEKGPFDDNRDDEESKKTIDMKEEKEDLEKIEKETFGEKSDEGDSHHEKSDHD